MVRGKEWSPRKYSSGEISDVLIRMIEENIENQRALTKYKGPDEGFRQYVADGSWDHYRYKLIGENTGFIYAAMELATNLDLRLPEAILNRAEMYSYPS